MEFNIFTFPLEQISWGLRQLSLSSVAGNIIAIVIYLLIGFIPFGGYLLLRKRGKLCKADGMLCVLSVLLWGVLYFMINPGLFQVPVAGAGKIILAGVFYSVLVGYLILRILENNAKASRKDLQRGLRLLLCMVMALFAVLVLVECFVNLPNTIQSVREGNTASMDHMMFESTDLTMTYVFLVLQSMLDVLPYILNMIVLFLTIKALDELLKDTYSENTVVAVKKISDFCTKALMAIVVSEMCLNIAQLIFRNQIYQIQINTTIPIFSILFIVAILVMARFIEENQKLKQENDLFI